jgi:hypothetical protein
MSSSLEDATYVSSNELTPLLVAILDGSVAIWATDGEECANCPFKEQNGLALQLLAVFKGSRYGKGPQ